MRTERSTNPSCFARVEGRAVAVDFDGGDFGRGRSATDRAIDLIRRFALSFKDRSLPAWRLIGGTAGVRPPARLDAYHE